MIKQVSNQLVQKTISKYRDKNIYNFNCAETIISTFKELYNFKIETRYFAGFGGGMGICSTCGAISASIGVLSVLFVKKAAHEDGSFIKKITQKFLLEVLKEIKTIDCKILKTHFYQKDIGCNNLITLIALTLNKTIQDFISISK